MAKRGRPYKITGEHHGVLVAIVETNPGATLEEIQGELKCRAGIEAHKPTIQKVLKEAGMERRVGGSGVCVEVAAPEAPRYGYTDAHRRLESGRNTGVRSCNQASSKSIGVSVAYGFFLNNKERQVARLNCG